LADLLEGKTLEIGKTVLTSTVDGWIENYYIPRTFNHQVVIQKSILKERFSDDLLATTEQEFRNFCQDNPQKNVHWLMEDESGRLIWQKSRGSLRALCQYIDTQNPLPYPPENLDEFLEQARCQKVMLIADTAGMGKTTVLTHLAGKIKQKFPTYWVVKVDLSGLTDVLEDLANQQIETNEILYEKLLKLYDPFDKELFKRCCQGLKEATKVVLTFDGFDEISPKYKKTVLDLLQDLNPQKQHWLDQLWVTTRPHLKEELEVHLQQLCYTLEPFSVDNQVGFLTKFWHNQYELQDRNQQQLETYARALIEKLSQSISDKEREFTGIPLQTRLLAEAFEEEVKTFCLSHKSKPELPTKLCLVGLYTKWIEKKLIIFLKKGAMATEQYTHGTIHNISVTENHQKLALEILFPELKDRISIFEELDMLAPEAMSRVGIVQYVDGKPNFIHRTFAEYYVADFLVKKLNKGTCFLSDVLNILFKILLETDYGVIRFFVDGLLVNCEKSKMIEQVAKWIEKHIYRKQLTRYRLEKILYQAATEANAYIIDFIFNSLKATGHSDTIYELLVVQYKSDYDRNAWLVATRSGHLQTLETVWDWGNKMGVNVRVMLLAKDSSGQTAWHEAALCGRKAILEKLWNWGREQQVNLKDDLLLSKDFGGRTAWHLAARNRKKEILEKLWSWGIEEKVNLKDDLLLSKDLQGQTAWHLAARNGEKEILEKLWSWGIEEQVNLKDDLLLSQDSKERTAWHLAARNGKKEILEKLWSWGIEEQVNLKDDLLLSKDWRGRTAWHLAALYGNNEILQKLWILGREEQVNLKDELLLSKDLEGKTAWHLAASYGKKVILEKLWVCGREEQVNLIDDLLLSKDLEGKTALHLAALRGKKDILEKLCSWGREEQVNLKCELLQCKDLNGRTAWNLAAMHGMREILD
jgi:ankyrin repeat protein